MLPLLSTRSLADEVVRPLAALNQLTQSETRTADAQRPSRMKTASGMKQPTTQLGVSTTSQILRSPASEQRMYASARERPRSRPRWSIIARTAAREASMRSGSTPVVAYQPRGRRAVGRLAAGDDVVGHGSGPSLVRVDGRAHERGRGRRRAGADDD